MRIGVWFLKSIALRTILLNLKICNLRILIICPLWWDRYKITAIDTLIQKEGKQAAHSSHWSIATLKSNKAHVTNILLGLNATIMLLHAS